MKPIEMLLHFSLQRIFRWGFSGSELDPEIGSNKSNFDARIYNIRVKRWMAVEPNYYEFINRAPFIGLVNNLLICFDINGKWIVGKDGAIKVTYIMKVCNFNWSSNVSAQAISIGNKIFETTIGNVILKETPIKMKK